MESCPVHCGVFSSISTHQITVVPSQFWQSNVSSDTAKLGGKLTQMRTCLVEIIGSQCVCDLIWFIPKEDYRLYLVVKKGRALALSGLYAIFKAQNCERTLFHRQMWPRTKANKQNRMMNWQRKKPNQTIPGEWPTSGYFSYINPSFIFPFKPIELKL